MSNWRKCRSCRRVQALSEYTEEHPQVCVTCLANPDRRPRDRPAGSSSDSVRAHRERTGNAYGKAYAKARAAAVRMLIDAHPEEFEQHMVVARRDAGLGTTSST